MNNCRNRIVFCTQDFMINNYDAMPIAEINLGLALIVYKVQSEN